MNPWLRSRATCTLALVFTVLAGCFHKSPPESVFVGHLTPLNGPYAAAGQHAMNGVALAVEDVNQDESQIAGRHIEVLHVNTSGETSTAQNEAIRLIDFNKVVALLGDSGAAQAENLGMLVQSNPYKVPLVTSAGLAGAPSSKYLFSVGLTPEARGKALAHFTAEKLQKTKVAVVVANRGAALAALADAFSARFGKERVKKWSFPSEADLSAEDRASLSGKRETDLAELARNVHEEMPQAVLIVGSAVDCAKLRTLLLSKGLGRAIPFLFGGDEVELPLLEADRQTRDGPYVATAFLADMGQESAKRFPRAGAFAKRFQDRFNEPPDVHAALAFDSASLLFEAMRRAHAYEGEKVQEQFGDLKDFETLTGPLSKRPVFVAQLKDGRPVLVESYQPE